ncbi:MAG TPA: PAS domain S-box protein [Fimbriimonadaceae bacterium]|jgi:PAS domain S-box-containing protein
MKKVTALDDSRPITSMASGEMLQLLAESAQDFAILMLDPKGHVLTWSPAAEQLKGYSAEEIIGKSFEVFYTKEDIVSGKPKHEMQVAKKLGKIEDESWRVRKDGSLFWANVIITALKDKDGALLGYGKLTRDLTKRKQAEEELERFFTLSIDLLCIASSDGYFKRVSPAFTKTLGWTVEQLTTTPFMQFVHPEDREATNQAVLAQIAAGKPIFQFENRYQHKDGSWRMLSWKSIPGPQGRMYASARDITDLNENQISLTQAKQEADRANAAKSDFLSRMSHELRTPLNAVIGYAQLLEMRSDDPKTLESAKAILKGGRHLLSLINEVLDLARIEAGKLTISLEPVQVSTTITHAVDLVRPVADERGVKITVSSSLSAGIHVTADRQRLVQVLLNLLTNAAKYNRPEGQITVTCSEGSRGTHRIEVSDTGTGIDEERRGWLFKPFERLGKEAGEGTGLGLALSKSLVEVMGGNLTLTDSSRNGSTFAIELPGAVAPKANPADIDAENRRDLHHLDDVLRVVYIEDNLANVRLMEKVFEDVGGIDLMPAMQASVGLQLVEDHIPDLILLDLHLPDKPGIDVLRELQSNPKTGDIPVIVLSADATENQIQRLLKAGAKAYLTKPVDLPALFAELEEVRSARKKAA